MDAESRIGKLVELITTTLAQYPERVRVETRLYDREIDINLVVEQEDMGRIIGRHGRVAHAMRDLIKASHTNPNLHVSLNIDCWQELEEPALFAQRQADDEEASG